jgi:hypothetical protein
VLAGEGRPGGHDAAVRQGQVIDQHVEMNAGRALSGWGRAGLEGQPLAVRRWLEGDPAALPRTAPAPMARRSPSQLPGSSR